MKEFKSPKRKFKPRYTNQNDKNLEKYKSSEIESFKSDPIIKILGVQKIDNIESKKSNTNQKSSKNLQNDHIYSKKFSYESEMFELQINTKSFKPTLNLIPNIADINVDSK